MVTSCVIVVQADRSDPFSLPLRYAKKSLAHPQLKGIVRQGQRCAALLARGQKTKIVFAGDTFGSYTVKKIDQQHVCLTRGADQITLILEKKEN